MITSVFSSNCGPWPWERLRGHWLSRAGIATATAFAGCLVLMPAGCIMAEAKTANVTISDTEMTPANLSVVRGDKLSLTIVNQGTRTHTFVVPDFYIFTQNLQPGETVTVAFTPDKSGSFPYYSDRDGKPEPGLVGTLRVQES